MPITFDDYDPTSDRVDWLIDPDSNAYTILAFLAEHPETGFSPKEIHEATGIPRGSVGTTLMRLEERNLIRHKEPYWAVNRRGVVSYETVLSSLKTVEASTVYDWGGENPDAYRIGLEALKEDNSDGNA